MNSATYQTGVVDHEVVAGAYHRQVGTLQGLMGAVDPARTRLAGYHVVGQDAAEQLGVSLELIDSAAGSLSNAALVGAKTVYSPPLRVSTRFTSGFSLPDRAEVRVLSIGLLEAAVATGSCAIPATDPGPVGFCAAYCAHPRPIRSAAGSAIAAVVTGAAGLVAGFGLVSCDTGLVLEQPAKNAIAMAARLAAAAGLA